MKHRSCRVLKDVEIYSSTNWTRYGCSWERNEDGSYINTMHNTGTANIEGMAV